MQPNYLVLLTQDWTQHTKLSTLVAIIITNGLASLFNNFSIPNFSVYWTPASPIVVVILRSYCNLIGGDVWEELYTTYLLHRHMLCSAILDMHHLSNASNIPYPIALSWTAFFSNASDTAHPHHMPYSAILNSIFLRLHTSCLLIHYPPSL